MPPQTPSPTGRPQNTWLPIALAFAVLVFSTIVTVAASLYFRDDEPAKVGPTSAATPSASPSATPRR